jgi:hypothetical protein
MPKVIPITPVLNLRGKPLPIPKRDEDGEVVIEDPDVLGDEQILTLNKEATTKDVLEHLATVRAAVNAAINGWDGSTS